MLATLRDNRINIVFQYRKDIFAKVKQLPTIRFHKPTKTWRLTLSMEIVERLEDMGFYLSPELVAWYNAQSIPAMIRVPAGLPDRLYEYQKEGVGWLDMVHGRGLLADEMGLGKTAQVLVWLNRQGKKAVVVCPSSMKAVWYREALTWTKLKPVVCHGTKPTRVDGDIIIINYDILHAWSFDVPVIVFDEAHFIKNASSRRGKAAESAAKKCKHVIGITGTPINSRPDDIYHIAKIINSGIFTTHFDFRKRYCGAYHNGYGWQNGKPTNVEELHNKLSSTIMLRRKKADVLKQLPPKRRMIVPIEIDNVDEYDKVCHDLRRWLAENKKNMAKVNALAKIEYLKQVCVAGKMDAMIEWIGNYAMTQKIVVFATHKKTIEIMADKLADFGVVIVDGQTKNRAEAVNRFQNDKNVNIFLGNMQAAGTGLTLTAASAVVFTELGWTSSDHDQCEDRVNRIGQVADSNEAYYMIADNTVEMDIVKLLDKKRKMVDGIIDNKETDETDLLSLIMQTILDK